MIMRGTTPRARTWGGAFAVLALAGLLLPLVPSWGQTPRGGGGEEERKAPAAGRPDDAQRQEEIKKVKEELDRAGAEMAKMRAQMEQAAAHMHQLQQRLQELAGPGKGGERITVIIRDADGKTRSIEVPPGGLRGLGAAGASADDLRRLRGFAEGAMGAPGAGAVGPRPMIGMGGGARGTTGPDHRIEALEQKVEAILREVENLRREMHRTSSPLTPGGGREGVKP